jgi:hypothetical protein
VYAFLPNKTQSTFEELLTAVVDKYNTLAFQLDHITVVIDVEHAIIKAISSTLGTDIRCHGCFYHFAQSNWRKIQSSLGHVTSYRDGEEAKLFCGMLDGLAFLPVRDVTDGLAELKENIPEGFDPVVDYFETTHIRSRWHSASSSHPQGSSIVLFRTIEHQHPEKMR